MAKLARKPIPPAELAIGLAVLAPSPALADAIDGDWCFGAQNLNIRGPKTRIPSGAEIAGDYGRHGCRHTIPGNEAGAGTRISTQLFGEAFMPQTRGSAAPELCKRCRPKVVGHF